MNIERDKSCLRRVNIVKVAHFQSEYIDSIQQAFLIPLMY